MTLPLTFSARTIPGAQRGRAMGYPTVNLEMADVPHELQEGIYACFAIPEDGPRLPAAMHYGPRPVFKAGVACEVHCIDVLLDALPSTLKVEVIERLRDVENFPSPEELSRKITDDVQRARAILHKQCSGL